jgi:hypothetical protein
MRFVTVRVESVTELGFHPLGSAMIDDPAVTPGPIHQVELVDGGTGISLSEIRAGLGRYREILAGSPYVIEYTATGGDRGYAYTHFELDDLSRRLLQFRRGSELMVETPIEFGPDGAIRVTLVGDAGAFGDALTDLPDAVDHAVLETGDYEPGVGQLFDRLTARQQEVLAAAVRAGYYDDPREATHEELAADLAVAPSTVGEHLRKIEARVLGEFIAH